MRTLSLTIAFVLTMALTACGYKTPLTLPKPKPDAVAPKPAPAPVSAPDAAKPDTK